MSDYLTKLKTQKQATGVLPKLPKAQKGDTEALPKLPKVPFGSKGSTSVGLFSVINNSCMSQAPPPNLSKIQPEHRAEYTRLWYQAHTLVDYVDGGEAVAPYAERAAKLPELNSMVERMRVLENMLKPTKTPKNALKN